MLPGGPTYMEDLDAAGGIPGVLSRFKKVIKSSPTVSGKIDRRAGKGRPRQERRRYPAARQGLSPSRAASPCSPATLRPNGSVVKQTAVSDSMMQFEGTAIVFDSEEEAMKAILANKIKARPCARHPL